jgi:predicted DNA-binding transcriptional regulator AlpA
MPYEDRYVDVHELADRLSVSAKTIRKWCREGTIPRGTKIGARLVRWFWPSVAEAVNARSRAKFAGAGA